MARIKMRHAGIQLFLWSTIFLSVQFSHPRQVGHQDFLSFGAFYPSLAHFIAAKSKYIYGLIRPVHLNLTLQADVLTVWGGLAEQIEAKTGWSKLTLSVLPLVPVQYYQLNLNGYTIWLASYKAPGVAWKAAIWYWPCAGLEGSKKSLPSKRAHSKPALGMLVSALKFSQRLGTFKQNDCCHTILYDIYIWKITLKVLYMLCWWLYEMVVFYSANAYFLLHTRYMAPYFWEWCLISNIFMKLWLKLPDSRYVWRKQPT